MTSIWKLVEAELSPEAKAKMELAEREAEARSQQQQQQQQGAGAKSRTRQGNGGSAHSKSKGGKAGKSRQGGYYADTPETRAYLAGLAVAQMECVMSADNLCMDTFVRSFMDEAGYIPVAYLCNYQNVAACGAPYESILQALSASLVFEADLPNETLRLRDKWQQVRSAILFVWLVSDCVQWLMPNCVGGFGLPRYIKQEYAEYLEDQEYAPADPTPTPGPAAAAVNAE